MKTLNILDKYLTIVSSLLDINKEELLITVDKEIIGSLPAYTKPEFPVNWSLGTYELVTKENKLIASWELYQMPHCCGIMVSTKAFVVEQYRGKRVGGVLNQLRQDIGTHLGFSLMFCTDIVQNIHQRQLLNTQGFQDIYAFVNRRTTNTVILSVINL